MGPKQSPSIRNPTPTLSKTSRLPHKAPTKRLKRESKHATLLSRISKTAPGSKVAKRRRPSKKLVTSLDSLADALPDGAPNHRANEECQERGNGEGEVKIVHKSLKSRPGAGKKKERLVAMEMERFARNMARMAAGSSTPSGMGAEGKEGVMDEGSSSGNVVRKGGSKERWAAIRGFISQTMERRPDEGAGK